MAKDPNSVGDDQVGYGKPPKHTQFQPGQSGNPKGRPKGPGNFHKMIAKHASKKVTVIENGVEKKMPKIDVVVSAMFNKASKGDVAAARLLTSLIAMSAQFTGDDAHPEYSEADFNAILKEADWQAQLAELKQAKEQADDDLGGPY